MPGRCVPWMPDRSLRSAFLGCLALAETFDERERFHVAQRTRRVGKVCGALLRFGSGGIGGGLGGLL